MKNEPAITVASITAGFTALLALLAAFGLPLTDEQTAAILGVVAVLAPLVVGLITRSQVTPTANVAARRLPDTGATVAGPAAAQSTGSPVTVTGPPASPASPPPPAAPPGPV